MRRIAGTVVLAVVALATGCGGDTADLEASIDDLDATSTPSTTKTIADARVREALEEQTAAAENMFKMCMGDEMADVHIDYEGSEFTPEGESTAAYEAQAEECMEMAQGLLGPPDPLEYGDIPLSDEELMYTAMAYLRDEDMPWVLPMDVRSFTRDLYCGVLVKGAEPGSEAVQAAMAKVVDGLSDDADGRLRRGIMETAFRHGCVEWLNDFEAATR